MTDTARVVIVFARAPLLGRVKTRLAGGVGDAAALRIYRGLGRLAVDTARALPDCRVVVAYTPAAHAREIRDWLGADVALLPQEGEALGARMLAAARVQATAGATRIALIGTDCPELTVPLLEQAFDALDRADAVFGPARDGGYYLAALRRPHVELFEDIPWSSPDTMRRTLQRAAEAALEVELLPELDDIDTADDWRRWSARHRSDGWPFDGV